MAERENNRSKKSSFVKQAAILGIASILVRFLGFIYRIPLTNMIGDTGNGIYAAGYYIYTFLLILSSAGLPVAISRLVAERIALKEYRNAHRVFQSAFVVSSSLGAFFALILWIFGESIAKWANTPEAYYCILTLSPTLFIVAVMSSFRGYFQGMNTMIPTAISQIVEQIFNAVFSVYLAYLFLKVGVPEGEKNIVMGAAGGTAGTGIGALAGLFVVGGAYWLIRPTILKKVRRCRQKHEETYEEVTKKLLLTAAPIIAGTAVFSITNLIDMNMVTRILEGIGYSHTDALDLYGQLSGKYVTLTTLPISLSTALAIAIIPSITSSMQLGEYKELQDKIRLTFRISMILSIPAAVGIGVLGEQIIVMLFPHETSGGSLLIVGSVSIIFLALCQTATGVLQGIGRLKIPVIGAILGAITKVILNQLLISIPDLNILGAVLSTTGCYMVASGFNMVMLARITSVRFDMYGSFIKPMLGATVMGVATMGCYYGMDVLFMNKTICTLTSILVGAFVYGITMLGIGGITKHDLLVLPMGGRMVKALEKYRFI